MVKTDLFTIFKIKIEPTPGFRCFYVLLPPVSPEVIHIHVLQTWKTQNPEKGLI